MRRTQPDIRSGRRTLRCYLAARMLSDAASPLFIPPVVFLLLGWIGSVPVAQASLATGLSAVFYSVIPFCTACLLLHRGYITSLDVPKQKSRNRLYGHALLSSIAGSTLLVLYFYSHQPMYAITALVFLMNLVTGYLINLKWKVSIHTGAVATAGTIFLSLALHPDRVTEITAWILPLTFLLVLLPLMTWARYYLRIHSLYELIGGALAGVVFTLIEISILVKIW